MIGITESIIVETIEEVKGSKYAVLYDKRSRNNWYKGKNDRNPKIKAENSRYRRFTTQLTIKVPWYCMWILLNRKDINQINETITTYKEL